MNDATPLLGDIDTIIGELETEFEVLRSVTDPIDDPSDGSAKFCSTPC